MKILHRAIDENIVVSFPCKIECSNIHQALDEDTSRRLYLKYEVYINLHQALDEGVSSVDSTQNIIYENPSSSY